MSITAACAEAEAAINRARSLFSPTAVPTPAPAQAGAALSRGAQTTTAAATKMSALSGQLVDTHGRFAGQSVTASTIHANTDATMGGHLDHLRRVGRLALRPHFRHRLCR
jgi:hypothetical protein